MFTPNDYGGGQLKAQPPTQEWGRLYMHTCYQTIAATGDGQTIRLLRTGQTVPITFSSNNPIDLSNGILIYSIDPNGVYLLDDHLYLNATWNPTTNQNYMINYSPAGWGVGGLSFYVEFIDPLPTTIQYPPAPIPNTWPPEYRDYWEDCVEFGGAIPYIPDFDGLCNQPEIELEVIPHDKPGHPQSIPGTFYYPFYGSIPDLANPEDCISENSDEYGRPVQNCIGVKLKFKIYPCDEMNNCPPFEFEKTVQFCCDCKIPLPPSPPYTVE